MAGSHLAGLDTSGLEVPENFSPVAAPGNQVHTDAGMFGAGVGAAMQKSGQALSDTGNVFFHMAHEQNMAMAAQSEAELHTTLQQKLTDYQQNNIGFNALKNIGGLQADINKTIDDKTSDMGLMGGYFRTQAAGIKSQYLRSASMWAASQHETATKASFETAAIASGGAAVQNRNDWQAVDTNLADVEKNARQRAQLEPGANEDSMTQAAMKARGNAVTSIAKTYALENNYGRLKELVTRNEGKIDPASYETILHDWKTVEAKAGAVQTLNGVPQKGATGDALDLIRGREGFREEARGPQGQEARRRQAQGRP